MTPQLLHVHAYISFYLNRCEAVGSNPSLTTSYPYGKFIMQRNLFFHCKVEKIISTSESYGKGEHEVI